MHIFPHWIYTSSQPYHHPKEKQLCPNTSCCHLEAFWYMLGTNGASTYVRAKVRSLVPNIIKHWGKEYGADQVCILAASLSRYPNPTTTSLLQRNLVSHAPVACNSNFFCCSSHAFTYVNIFFV